MKRFGAIVAVILLVSLYLTTLVCAIIGNDFAMSMLKASIFGTIFIPVLLYTYLFILKAFNPSSKMEDDEENKDTENHEDHVETDENENP